jgi:hypothetical protein
MAVEYDREATRRNLLQAASRAAGELTAVFFDRVDTLAPVESGHLHQTLGTALVRAGVPEAADVTSSMLSKGSGDPTASTRSFGSKQELESGVRVTVGTHVGFVSRLNDGALVEPDVDGASGYKTAGAATVGVLYAPRNDSGPTGFLMWYVGGQPFYTRMAVWQPLGFFEEAAVALRNKATEMGMT